MNTDHSARFVVCEVRPDGVPRDGQRFDSLEDALDLRDELRKRHPWPARVHYFVIDAEDGDRGALDHDDLYEEVT